MFKTQVVLMQSFEHFDVISMIDKSRDHGILSSIFVFYGNIDSFWRPFLLKFLGRWCWAREKEENKWRCHQVISIVCTVIDHSFDQAALKKSIFFWQFIDQKLLELETSVTITPKRRSIICTFSFWLKFVFATDYWIRNQNEAHVRNNLIITLRV